MTHPDDHRYPPPAPPGWPQQRPEPYAPRYHSYGYDTSRYDSYTSYDSYGHDARYAPYAAEPEPHSTDLAALRSAYRVLRRVSTLTALGSFVVYVALSCCAPGLMGAKVAGEVSLGMALGVLQLVVTFAAVVWYGRSAERFVDPLAQVVRERTVRPGRDAGVAR
ncbi:DUF485 domain-containing protein [Streptomyces sp. NPDC020298]|uniref:DUF485 domain-containing protein n=1 Tax=unclassified Streptomyces TaxID=2593676 RepID=UPI00341118BE